MNVSFFWGVLAASMVVGCGDDTSATGAGGSGAGGDGGEGGTTTTGMGGDPGCNPGDTEPCYDGPSETANVGVCADGTRTCSEDREFGSCEGQTLPALVEECDAVGDEDCDGVSCSEHALSMTFATIGVSAADSLAFGASGNLTIGGNFFEAMTFVDEGPFVTDQSIYLVRITPDGQVPWYTTVTAGFVPVEIDLAVAPNDGIVFAGGFEGEIDLDTTRTSQGGEDAFVARLDAQGDYVWETTAGDGALSQRVTSVALDADGDVLVVGVFSGALDFGGGATVSHLTPDLDVFVAKLDGATGEGIWATSYGDPALDDDAPALAVDDEGNALLAGGFRGTIAPAGAAPITAATDLDVYVAKIDPDSAAVWANPFGGAGDQSATGVGSDADGNVYVGGSMHGTLAIGDTLTVPDATADAFTAKLDPAGEPLHAARYDDTGDTLVDSIDVGADGDVSLVGTMTGTADFGGGDLPAEEGETTPFLANLDHELEHRWSKSFAASFTPLCVAVDHNDTSNVATGGYLTGPITFGETELFTSSDAIYQAAFAVFQP